jgi:hypothetical protein
MTPLHLKLSRMQAAPYACIYFRYPDILLSCMHACYAFRRFTPHKPGDIESLHPQPLTRLAPIPIRYLATDPGSRYFGYKSARTTHPGDSMGAASSFFAFLIRRAILRPRGDMDIQRFLDTTVADYLALDDDINNMDLLIK